MQEVNSQIGFLTAKLISQKITYLLIGETNLKHSFEMLLSMDWRLELKIMKKDFKLLLKVQDIQT